MFSKKSIQEQLRNREVRQINIPTTTKELRPQARGKYTCNCCGAETNELFDVAMINFNERVMFCTKECFHYYMGALLY